MKAITNNGKLLTSLTPMVLFAALSALLTLSAVDHSYSQQNVIVSHQLDIQEVLE